MNIIAEFEDNKFTSSIGTGSLKQFKSTLLFIYIATDSLSFDDKVLLQLNDYCCVIKNSGFDIICWRPGETELDGFLVDLRFLEAVSHSEIDPNLL